MTPKKLLYQGYNSSMHKENEGSPQSSSLGSSKRLKTSLGGGDYSNVLSPLSPNTSNLLGNSGGGGLFAIPTEPASKKDNLKARHERLFTPISIASTTPSRLKTPSKSKSVFSTLSLSSPVGSPTASPVPTRREVLPKLVAHKRVQDIKKVDNDQADLHPSKLTSTTTTKKKLVTTKPSQTPTTTTTSTVHSTTKSTIIPQSPKPSSTASRGTKRDVVETVTPQPTSAVKRSRPSISPPPAAVAPTTPVSKFKSVSLESSAKKSATKPSFNNSITSSATKKRPITVEKKSPQSDDDFERRLELAMLAEQQGKPIPQGCVLLSSPEKAMLEKPQSEWSPIKRKTAYVHDEYGQIKRYI
eukprot:gene2549-2921_t